MPDVNSNVPNAPPPPPMGDANPPAAKPNTAPPTAGLGSSGFLSQLQAKRTNMKEVVADDRQRAPTASDDVTAILMRRMAMEMSDSEGSGSEEDDWSSEEESD